MRTRRLGIPEIDAEHQNLHEIVSRLQDAIDQDPPSQARIGELLSELVAQTRRHFESEEAHMRRHQYSVAGQHGEEHEHLLRALESVAKMHRTGEMPADRPVVQFLWDWLNDHVASSDEQYAAYLRSLA